MDSRSLAILLQQTLDPGTRQQAEAELEKVSKIIGFVPGILQVVMTNSVDLPVRQAGVIYVKNMISSHWTAEEKEASPAAIASGLVPPVPVEIPFSIHEQDKGLIRENLVDAAVQSPEVIRIQLAVCVSLVIKQDYPHKWPEVVDKISIYLQTPDLSVWPGALTCLYQLVKNYEYKKSEERGPINDAMNLLLPLLFEIVSRCINDQSSECAEVRKSILKIFHALTQYVLPLDLINKEFFTKWMEIVCMITELEIPPVALDTSIDEEERPQLIWWKEKKWALHILTRIFERYGSPGNVVGEYKEFSTWYLNTFSQGVLTSILKVLDAYRRGVYVSPRVVQQALNYLNTGVSHGFTWKFIKPHIMEIIKDILFPLMSYTQEDAELWESDPHEYVRVKFDVFEDYVSPSAAAQCLLHSTCKKRKDILPKTMNMLLAIVQDGNSTPSQRDGGLHMIGGIADILLKKKNYKDQIENFLVSIVFPEFASPHGHLRARACWMLHYFADVKFKNQDVLGEAIRLTVESLLKTNEAIPVKVEAAVALQMILDSQDEVAKKYIEPKIRDITLELLNIIRETEHDDLTMVMQKIVCTYTEQLIPVATDMCNHLVETFAIVLESSEDDGKAITTMGILNTLETILTVMEDEEIHSKLEPIVLRAIHHIFTKSFMEFYEEAFSLACDLTSKSISDDMWSMLKVIYDVYEKDGVDYFTDMMPVLHNYVTVDTVRLLSNRDYITAIFLMCKKMLLEGDPGEDPQVHAAKLLEVIILQCKCNGHNIDELIPSFVEVVFIRLSREIKTSELRTMCLQVAIAAMYYNSTLFFQTLQNSSVPGMEGSLIKKFVDQWLHDTDCFIGLHDRKVCVLGICLLITMPEVPGLEENSDKILPSLIVLFHGLKRVYEAQGDDSSDEDSDSENGDADDDILETDEDEIDESSAIYLETLERTVKTRTNGAMKVNASLQDGDSDESDEDEDDDDDDDEYDETLLESFTTPLDGDDTNIDEYEAFTVVMQTLQYRNPDWLAKLMKPLSEGDQESLKEIVKLSEKRKEARKSRDIEKQGGYQFQQQSVPGSFSFASPDQSFAFGK